MINLIFGVLLKPFRRVIARDMNAPRVTIYLNVGDKTWKVD